MSILSIEELKNIKKHPILKRAKKILDSLNGVKLAYPLILEIQHEWEDLRKKLETLGY